MSTLTGITSAVLLGLNTVLACIPLFAMGLLRLLFELLRLEGALDWLARKMDLIIDYWVGTNRVLFRVFGIYEDNAAWEGAEKLSRGGWYVTVSNHQTWPDILILQTILRRVPPVKFFTKQQLIWIPFLGLAMWLLGFPYVRRMSREQIAANPALLELDRQATLDACEGFRNHPTTVLNFLEGTRFTTEKHANQKGRFRALLNPKTGGLNMVISGLEDKLDCLIDVTIDYPNGTPTFWEFMKGECRGVEVLAQCREIPAEVHTAADEQERRQALEHWVEALWQEKDVRLRHRHQVAEPELTG